MKEITIRNEFVTAVISEQAAEVISFKRNDNGIEMIWCRDPAYWFNCNPVLFPYTGPLIDGKYEYKGNTYELGQHGFARRARFTFTQCDDTSTTLVLKYSEETMKVYPFRFELTVNYRLEGCKLILSYKVTNLDEVDLPFDIGFHPAFNCPMTPDKKYSDYCIEFEQEENLAIEGREDLQIPYGNSFPVDKYLVSGSFFYFNNQIKSKWSQLTDGEHTIRVGNEGYPTLGYWKKQEDAPFICIEPWSPENDLRKECFFRDDSPVNLLEPEGTFECSYYFEIVK